MDAVKIRCRDLMVGDWIINDNEGDCLRYRGKDL